MSEFKTTMKGSQVSPEMRVKILAKVYATILSWPDPIEKQTEPAVPHLGRNEAADSDTETPANADGTISIHPTDEANEGGSL